MATRVALAARLGELKGRLAADRAHLEHALTAFWWYRLMVLGGPVLDHWGADPSTVPRSVPDGVPRLSTCQVFDPSR